MARFLFSSHRNATCTLFTVSCSCSSKGALAAINKDPGPLEEAITRGDLSTAKKLLGITESETESGELTLVGINPLTPAVYQYNHTTSRMFPRRIIIAVTKQLLQYKSIIDRLTYL